MKKYLSRQYPYYYEVNIETINRRVVKSGVKEILKTAEKYLKKDTKNISALDVGSGRGEYSIEMAKFFKEVVGVEPYDKVCIFAKKSIPNKMKKVKFYNSTIEKFKTKKKFDLIVALTIFEHLSNPKAAFDVIFSLLKKNGIIYLTAPNKYWLFEQHYGLPFLSWLPLTLSNVYLQTFKGVNSFKDSSYARGYFGMKKFFNRYDCTYKFILPFDKNSAFIGCGKQGAYSYIKRFGVSLIEKFPFFWLISKGFIMVIKKNE